MAEQKKEDLDDLDDLAQKFAASAKQFTGIFNTFVEKHEKITKELKDSFQDQLNGLTKDLSGECSEEAQEKIVKGATLTMMGLATLLPTLFKGEEKKDQVPEVPKEGPKEEEASKLNFEVKFNIDLVKEEPKKEEQTCDGDVCEVGTSTSCSEHL